MAFVIWCLCGCLFIGLGVFAFFSKKPVGFWANVKTFAVNDVKKYNAAMGKLFCIYGLVFDLLGLPLLDGQSSPLAIVSVVGVMLSIIVLMVIYVTVIEPKYKKK